VKLAALSAVFAICALAQDLQNFKVEKVAGGYTFTEGPVWSREGFLLFSDVPANHIIKIVPGEKPVVLRDQSNGANGNNYDSRGRLYTCESRTRRVVRMDKNGRMEVVAERYEGKRFNAPNDIVVRKDGHVYFTDPAFGKSQNEGREMDYYGIYHITPRGDVKLVMKTEGLPNGITLSPDGRTLYVSFSDERVLRAYDVDRSGEVSNARVLVKDIDGPPDGIAIDEKGNIYVTANKLDVYNPEGKLLGQIETGETPRNCAFGDADLQTLYVTAYTSVYRIRLDVKGSVQY
jgi:gluconolactonase